MVGSRLQEVRREHGDTQKTLAEKLGVSKPTVQAWELEKSAPGHNLLVTICRMYNVSSDYLLGLSDSCPMVTLRRQDRLSAENREMLSSYEAFLRWRQQGTVAAGQ